MDVPQPTKIVDLISILGQLFFLPTCDGSGLVSGIRPSHQYLLEALSYDGSLEDLRRGQDQPYRASEDEKSIGMEPPDRDEDILMSVEEKQAFRDELDIYLDTLDTVIATKNNTPDIDVTPSCTTSQVMLPHQKKAFSFMVYSVAETAHEGMILADPAGMGKSLPSIEAIRYFLDKNPENSKPCVIIAPLNCCKQWHDTVTKTLDPAKYPSTCIVTTPRNLHSVHCSKIIITSYDCVRSEAARYGKYCRQVAAYRSGQSCDIPKRPNLAIFSSRLCTAPERSALLVLDEAHVIRHVNSKTHKAVSVFRSMFKGCIMLTATPMQNTWDDILGLLVMLKTHPVYNVQRLELAFTDEETVSGVNRKTARLLLSEDGQMKLRRLLEAVVL